MLWKRKAGGEGMKKKQRYFMAASIAIFLAVWLIGDIIEAWREEHCIKILIDSSGRARLMYNGTGLTLTNLYFELVK